MDDSVARRQFRANVLLALDELREKVERLDMEGNWHTAVIDLFGAIQGLAGMVLNAANAEVLRRNRERAKKGAM